MAQDGDCKLNSYHRRKMADLKWRFMDTKVVALDTSMEHDGNQEAKQPEHMVDMADTSRKREPHLKIKVQVSKDTGQQIYK